MALRGGPPSHCKCPESPARSTAPRRGIPSRQCSFFTRAASVGPTGERRERRRRSGLAHTTKLGVPVHTELTQSAVSVLGAAARWRPIRDADAWHTVFGAVPMRPLFPLYAEAARGLAPLGQITDAALWARARRTGLGVWLLAEPRLRLRDTGAAAAVRRAHHSACFRVAATRRGHTPDRRVADKAIITPALDAARLLEVLAGVFRLGGHAHATTAIFGAEPGSSQAVTEAGGGGALHVEDALFALLTACVDAALRVLVLTEHRRRAGVSAAILVAVDRRPDEAGEGWAEPSWSMDTPARFIMHALR